ncbi:FtsW/RodA/SpoVE family cell cycle protein [Vallitalea guaymasensis]|uniref:Probable peptidoglycan glycosyltransferase FtsW n=1 Tax=Vallitalea guaymasensis TaxID=1185412 RepID=A0A8J8SE07_9FIRM|nr:FtsW/RodA/SpoVE family cell cycle protein [Vallitalea guaymasensis]QUH31418.1 FtsW/RodA/SpoVE family cell cycle protein [Vallitalea guaymasensis]
MLHEKTIKRHRKKRSLLKKKKNQTDFTLVAIVVILIVFGIIMIYSSSYYYSIDMYNDSTHYLKKQIVWGVLGIVVMMIVSRIDFHIFNRFALLIYIMSLGFLVLVLLVGKEIKGAKRWLIIGPVNFQPSEFAKLMIIIVIAYIASKMVSHLDKYRLMMFILFIIGIPTALVGATNMSTAIVVFAIGVAILFVAVPKVYKLMLITALPGAVGAVLGILLAGYRADRVKIWLEGPWTDPLGKGYQTIQSLYAIGTGGLFGTGLGQSMQKRGFIPEAHNDIIFSIVCEELGLFGALALIILFILLIWRCMVIASNCSDLNSLLIVVGVMAQIGLQVIINIAVVTNSIPATGMPLPFISYGGSSLLFLMVEIGMVLGIARRSKISKAG